MAEPADAYGSGPYGETRGGSTPLASSSGRQKRLPVTAELDRSRYFALDLLLAAQRAFIRSESLLRPAAVSAPLFFAGALFVPPAFLLAAQRAFISCESFLRPAGVS